MADHDEEHLGWKSVVPDTLKSRKEEKIQEDRRFTKYGLRLFFPEISQVIVSCDSAYKKKCVQYGFLGF